MGEGLKGKGGRLVTTRPGSLSRVLQGDYENVSPSCPEDDSIHYSELVQFGAGKRPQAKEDVDYVTLKH